MENTNNNDDIREEKVIPDNIIQGINEFAYGGFILFTFSSKGRPLFFTDYETAKDRLALLQTVQMFVEKELEESDFRRVEEDDCE